MQTLFNGLKKYASNGISSFHTPGHSGNAPFISDILKAELDLTELDETASLYDGGDLIEASEIRTAKIFGAEKSLYSAGGCTLCIQTMLRLCAIPNGKVVTGRVIHKSAVNAMALLGLEPIWLYPDNSAGDYFCGRISSDDVKKALRENSGVCAVYITTPDYFGVVSNLSEISKHCKEHSVPLIVDNAHGSHFIFFDGMHPLKRGADMTACSLHKTLPVLTGGAVLNISNPKYSNLAKQAMADFGSTSPSFLTLASIDLCTEWMQSRGKDAFSLLEKRANELKNTALNSGFGIAEGESDKVRLSLNTAKAGVTADNACKYFRSRLIEPEMRDGSRLVFILTPFNSERDFERLFDALTEFKVDKSIFVKEEINHPIAVMSLREAFLAPKKRVRLRDAAGHIAAQSVCSCPPGVPPVMAGEIVNEETVHILSNYGFEFLNIVK